MTTERTRKVREVADVYMGQSPPSTAVTEGGAGFPFLQGNAEFGTRYPATNFRCAVTTRVASSGDYLLSVRAPVGALNQASEKTVFGRGLCALRFPETDRHFAWHALQFASSDLNRVAQGSTFFAVSRTDVEDLEIPWLGEENMRIASVLDTVDAVIESSEAVLAKLRQVRAGLLHDLLTRGLDADGQLRDPDAHPEQFKDSPLGRIPREWDVRRLSEMCVHLGSGLTPRGGQDVYTSAGVMLIRSQNVHFDGLRLDEVAFISENTHLGMRRSEVQAHDVLYNITGASIGRCCAMPDGLGAANVNQHVCILRVPYADASSASFLAAVLSSPIGQQQLEALNTTGNRQGLNFQQLGAFLIPWPESFQEQQAIAAHLATHDCQIAFEEASLAKLHHFKSGLMADLLKGRVRVPENLNLSK